MEELTAYASVVQRVEGEALDLPETTWLAFMIAARKVQRPLPGYALFLFEFIEPADLILQLFRRQSVEQSQQPTT